MPDFKFDKESMLEMMDSDVLIDSDGNEHPVKTISNKIYEKSRWSDHHEWIFQVGDRYFRTYYSSGSTESQDESPWEYDEPEVTEMEKYEKTVAAYRPKTAP